MMDKTVTARDRTEATTQIEQLIRECTRGVSDREEVALRIAQRWRLDESWVRDSFAEARGQAKTETEIGPLGDHPAAQSVSRGTDIAAPLDAALDKLNAPSIVPAKNLSTTIEAVVAAIPKAIGLSHDAPRDNAQKFAGAMCKTAGVLTTWHWDEKFWRWNGSFYESIGDKQIEDEIWKFLDDGKLPNGARFVPRPRYVNELKIALKSAIYIDPKLSPPAWIGEDALEIDPHNLLVFQNVLHDVETGAVLGLHPGLWTHDGAGYDFDPDAECPRWEQFLGEVFDDQQSRDTLEEMLGYCMTYDTKFEKGFVLFGVRRSGKSTVMSILERLIGSKSYIGLSFSTLGNENSFQDVIGKKVMVFPDARFKGERKFFNGRDAGGINPNVAEFLLNVTGRDTISLGQKYKGRWQGRLPAKIVITTNETPNLYDSSGVLPSRFITLNFQNSMYDREDVHLRTRLEGELPGIAARCLVALRRLEDRGRFVQPDAGKDVGVAMVEKITPLAGFCREMLEMDPSEHTMTNLKLCQIFHVWCEDTGNDWLKRSIPNNQLVGKLREITGFEGITVFRPHAGTRVYNLKKKAKGE